MGNVMMEASQINYRGGAEKMSVEQALKETSGEAAAIAALQATKANQATIAPAFDATATYEAGDLVYYNGTIYRCTNDHTGDWDATDFSATTIAGELNGLNSNITSKVGIATATDLNGEKSIGVKTFDYTATGIPSDHSGTALCLFHNENYGMQIAQSSSESEAYIRFYNIDTWSSWDKIAKGSDFMSAAKAVYKDSHQIAAGGNYTYTPTLEENHAYLVTICSGNNLSWGYCGIMLKGWVSDAPVLSDIYKGTCITVSMVNTDSIQVSNNESQYDSTFEIVVIDLGRGGQGS